MKGSSAMYKNDDMEQLLEKLAKENPKEMENIDGIDDSVLDRIEKKALMNAVTIKEPKRGNYFFIKAVAALVVLFGLFSIALYMFDMPNTRATEDPSVAPNETPLIPAHEMNIPEYIPDGYNLDYIIAEPDYNGNPGYEIKYVDADDKDLFILIRVYGDPIRFKNEDVVDHIEKEIGAQVYFITYIQSEVSQIYLQFEDGWGDVVQILTTLDEETLMELIESMH
jgi:hypothetical protein